MLAHPPPLPRNFNGAERAASLFLRPLRMGCLGLVLIALACTPASADLQVNLRRDTVELEDGTKLECLVLMETPRGLLVVVKDPEKPDGVFQKLIPAAQVKKVTRGPDEGQIKGLKTEAELARKVVQGSGYRKEGKDPSQLPPVAPTGPITTALPPVQNQPAEPPAPGVQPAPASSKLSPQQVADAYLSRYPALQEVAQTFLGGTERVAPLIQRARDGDATVREPLEGFLGLFLKSKPAVASPTAPMKPAPTGKIQKPAPPQAPSTTQPEKSQK